jgi:hypothetical protein
MSLILTEAIHPDQTFPAKNYPGAICIHYPRGSSNVLSVNTDVEPPTQRSIPMPPGGDGRYEEFWLRSDGNYQTVSDRSTSIPVIFPGYQAGRP